MVPRDVGQGNHRVVAHEQLQHEASSARAALLGGLVSGTCMHACMLAYVQTGCLDTRLVTIHAHTVSVLSRSGAVYVYRPGPVGMMHAVDGRYGVG